MKDESPTERQVNYAKDLGIEILPWMTKVDVSAAISAHVENDRPATDRHFGFARQYGVNVSSLTGKKDLFDQIFFALNAPGREMDLASWFVFRVYRTLMHGDEHAPIDDPSHTAIREIAEELCRHESAGKSIRRYKGRELIWFGSFTTPSGEVYMGGSDRTIAYKMAAFSLRNTLDIKADRKNKNRVWQERIGKMKSERMRFCHDCGKRISKSSGRCPFCGARHDYGGYAMLFVFVVLIAIIYKCIT